MFPIKLTTIIKSIHSFPLEFMSSILQKNQTVTVGTTQKLGLQQKKQAQLFVKKQSKSLNFETCVQIVAKTTSWFLSQS